MLVCISISICLFIGLCVAQAPVRLVSISNPNRFDFSLLALGAPDGSVLIAGTDFLTRVAPDFQQSSISNVQNLPQTLSMVAFDHFNNRYFACSREQMCHFYATSNLSNSVASVTVLGSTGGIPKAAVFAMQGGAPAVFVYGSFLTSSKTSTRYSLQAFQLTDLVTQTGLFVGEPFETGILRKLISTFSHADRLYFVVRHFESSTHSTRLFSVCNNTGVTSNKFDSVLEIVLTECDSSFRYLVEARVTVLQNGMSHLVLVYRASEESDESRLCAVSLSDLVMFVVNNYNIIGTSVPLEWLDGSESRASSFATSFLASFSPCDFEIGTIVFPLMIPASASATTFPSTPLLPTAYSAQPNTYGRVVNLLVATQDTLYYLFIVTEQGYLLKYYISGSSLTSAVSLLEVRPVSSSFRDRVSALEPSGSSHLLALTPRELLRIPLDDCARHLTCSDCVSDPDPLCGWCSLQRECSSRSLCSQHALVGRWIQTDSGACLAVTSVTPDTSPLNLDTNITVSAINLPQLAANNTFLCVFPSLGSTQVSAVTGGQNLTGPAPGPVNLTCPTPVDIPSINQSATTISLYLSSSEFPSTILHATFPYTLFYCSYHTSCQSCVSLSDLSPCGWCVYSGGCTHSPVLCPSFNTSLNTSQWVQTDDCPSLSPLPLGSLFATENSNLLQLMGANLPPPIASFQYECQLQYGTSWYNSSADYLSPSSLSCLLPSDVISLGVPSLPASLLLSLSSRPLALSQLSLYACGRQGNSCSECLSTPLSAPLCGWCLETGGDTCDTNRCQGTFLNATCPTPQILSVSPSALPVQYSGLLSITGTELGTVTDTATVTLEIGQPEPAAFQCVLSETNQQTIGREISCTIVGLLFSPFRIPGSSNNFTLTLRITSPLGVTRTASHAPLLISSPLIQALSPSFGPAAGGTRVRVTGIGLGIGVFRSAEIIGTANCSIVAQPSYVDGDLECVTESVPATTSGQFGVTIDGTIYKSTSGLFQFRANPQILSFSPKAVIPSSNFSLTFKGISLDAASSPRILFYSGRQPGYHPCMVLPAEEGVRLVAELLCPFPQAATSATRRQIGGTSAVNFTLVFDGYTVPSGAGGLDVEIVANPTFVQTVFRLEDDMHFVVDAINTSIDLAFIDTPNYQTAGLSALFAVELESADSPLNITSVVTYQPGSLSVALVNLPVDKIQTLTFQIFVTLGSYRTPAGRVEVVSGLEAVSDKGYIVIGGLLPSLVLILVLVLVLVCLFCCLRKRGRLASEEVEKLLFEMDTIENRVAQACRTEFAELNTELGDAADLTQGAMGGTPFLSFHRFVMNVMFPGQPDHPVMHPVRIPPDIDDKEFLRALELFEELLRDKDYFLSLVNCIESNRSFSLRDRSNIASLFALCMHEDIRYLTEVLRTLLEDLAERMVAQSRAKLMFRRTESVAEKLLSDWLAMLMYGHLIEGAGPAIHLAYRATKRQTEKGPVDVFTGEARHSLAKERILTQLADIEDMREVEAEVLTEKDESIRVKLLDCDTISQAKLKIMDAIYCGVPVSQRPLPTTLDLELHSTRKQGAGLILRDSDHTSQVQEDWKRVNTLSHYGAIKQVFKLVPRTQKMQGGQVFDYMGTLLPVSAMSPHRDRSQQEEERVWHLVKPQEQTQTSAKSKKLATEIYLMRLISTKNILQKYLDDMIAAIFPDIALEPHKLAPPIKFLFDLLEKQADNYDIDDKPNTIRLWKNNSVPLRFWATLVRNPEYLFDIIKSETVESNLTVIAQVFVDSCLVKDTQVIEDAHTTSILYNKEVPVYRERILNYYEAVSNSPAVSEEMLFENYQVPRGGDHFYRESALQALYSYAHSCKDKLVEEMLDDGRFDTQVAKFEEICELLSRHSK